MKLNQLAEKDINISITKIYNWPKSEGNCSFELIFYPEEEDTPIIHKSVGGLYMGNCINLNCLLKITYTNDEKIVILEMLKNTKDRVELLGHFLIDLDVLRLKNVQYFPFAGDHVLQINLYTPVRPNSHISLNEELSIPRLHQLSSSRTISKRVGSSRQVGAPRYEHNHFYKQQANLYDSRDYSSESFSQKVFTLLQEVKQIKYNMSATSPRGSREAGVYEALQIDKLIGQDRQFKKSKSDTKFGTYGSVPTTSRRDDLSKRSGQQKHRLILSTLSIVPYSQTVPSSPRPTQTAQHQHQSKLLHNENILKKVSSAGQLGSTTTTTSLIHHKNPTPITNTNYYQSRLQ